MSSATQRFRSCPVFGALAVIDIGSSYIQRTDVLFVVERVVTEEEPAILTVLPERLVARFQRQPRAKPAFRSSRTLSRSSGCTFWRESRGDYVLHGEAGIVEPLLGSRKRSGPSGPGRQWFAV